MKKDEILLKLQEIKEKEDKLLHELSEEVSKEKKKKKKLVKLAKHFSFNDFAQCIIGSAVFGLPALINTSFWDYLPKISLATLGIAHLFFVLCVLLSLNYEFRDNMILDKYFFIILLKRLLFVYVSVGMFIILMLILLKQIALDMTNYLVIKHFFAGQSIGLFGAITFGFFKKE